MRMHIFRMAMHILLLGALGGCAKETETQPATVEVVSAEQASAFARSCMDTARLNAPATPENSYLQDFGYGAILRVPKCLVSNFDYTKLKQPVKFEEIGMTFYYPDMTLKDWSPEKTEERTEDSPWAVLDRFSVRILWMYYVPPDSDSFIPGSPQPDFRRDPRPPRIELNRHCIVVKNGQCDMPMRRVPSGIDGIDAIYAEDWVETHPEAAIHDFKKGGSYLAKPESPYELFMACESLYCMAYVYSKKHHFQYRMQFRPQVVTHTDELIRAIDSMLDQWTVK